MKYQSVALASFPRSGNTWIRHLIYEATGTGSRYALNPETDLVHQAAAIPQIADEESPFVKTHGVDASEYEAAVHIVRNPYNAIASYLDYCENFNVSVGDKDEFVEKEAIGWVRHTQHWRMAQSCGILPAYFKVRYEDLYYDTYAKLWEILRTFLQMDVPNEAIEFATSKITLSHLQEKGHKQFFPHGMNRKPFRTIKGKQVSTIERICTEEMQEWGYIGEV